MYHTCSHYEMTIAEFVLIHCKIIFNTAQYIFHVLQPVTNSHVKIKIIVHYILFENNKTGIDLLNLKLVTSIKLLWIVHLIIIQ